MFPLAKTPETSLVTPNWTGVILVWKIVQIQKSQPESLRSPDMGFSDFRMTFSSDFEKMSRVIKNLNYTSFYIMFPLAKTPETSLVGPKWAGVILGWKIEKSAKNHQIPIWEPQIFRCGIWDFRVTFCPNFEKMSCAIKNLNYTSFYIMFRLAKTPETSLVGPKWPGVILDSSRAHLGKSRITDLAGPSWIWPDFVISPCIFLVELFTPSDFWSIQVVMMYFHLLKQVEAARNRPRTCGWFGAQYLLKTQISDLAQMMVQPASDWGSGLDFDQNHR